MEGFSAADPPQTLMTQPIVCVVKTFRNHSIHKLHQFASSPQSRHSLTVLTCKVSLQQEKWSFRTKHGIHLIGHRDGNLVNVDHSER